MNTQEENLSESGKPDCSLCKEEDGLSEELASSLLYSLFNPYAKKEGCVSSKDYIKQNLEDGEALENFETLDAIFKDLIANFGYSDSSWIEKVDEFRRAKQKAWEQIKKELMDGSISEEELSPSDLIENLGEEIIKDLMKEGYVEGYERRRYRKMILFSKHAERMIGEKIVQLAVEELPVKKPGGDEEIPKKSVSIFSSYFLTDYDPFTHVFDNIDLSETLLNCALKDDFSFDEKNIVAREPKHLEKITYIMLIDVSDSMRGKKFVGAIESAIGLREAIKRRDSRELKIIAFNHRAREVDRGEILNLYPQGRTDIGLALKKARESLKKSDGTGVVFLITDGEPTSSFNPYISPGMCAVREAKRLRNVDARLSIIMLGRDESFRRICEHMAKACGRSRIFYFSDPLNLKNYFIKSFMKG
ncbi:VWA domain-containing protein [Archaeoglobales archaeon]|nr:MAG: VWA domain-containing protein [Archaeoglobales archaeon]